MTRLKEWQGTARKEHNCDWCTEKIQPGTKYTRLTIIYDGDLQDQKYHTECNKAYESSFWDKNGPNYQKDEFSLHSFKRGCWCSLDDPNWVCDICKKRDLQERMADGKDRIL